MKQVSSGLEVIWSFKTIIQIKVCKVGRKCTRSGFSPFAAHTFHQIEMFKLVYVEVQKVSFPMTHVAAYLETIGQ